MLFLGPLMKVGLPLMKNVLTPQMQEMQLFKKEIYQPGITTLMISKQKMKVIMKSVKSFEESGLLTKSVTEALEMKQKNRKAEFSA